LNTHAPPKKSGYFNRSPKEPHPPVDAPSNNRACGFAIAAASLCSISPKLSQPIAMVARSFERMMPDTTGTS